MNMNMLLLLSLNVIACSAFVPEELDDYNVDEYDGAHSLEPGRDPLEGDYFEGDIILDVYDELVGRNGLTDLNKRWSNGVIPYVISSKFNKHEREVIADAMGVYHNKTCIKFVPNKAGNKYYLNVKKGSGCSSYVGKSIQKGQQVILGSGCVSTGIVQHEFMHAAGFWHEQSRHDRNDYVKVILSNVPKSLRNNFQRLKIQNSNTFGQEYDYGSVMHYGSYAFAKNRKNPTIIPKVAGVEIGQRDGLSVIDIAKLNALYECNQATDTSTSTQTTKKAPCEDQSSKCKSWSVSGFCTDSRYVAYMKKNCKNSCQVC